MNKPVFLLILSLLATLILPIVLAQDVTGTEVGGIIQENTTWTPENSPYTLTGNILVNNGVSLTIQDGTIVNLGSYYIMVNGTLQALGSHTNPITFDDGQIIFTQNSTNWNQSTETGCVIQNAVISSTLNINNSPKLCNSTLYNQTTIQTTTGMPLIINNIIKGGMVIVGNGNVSDNTIMDQGIEVFGSNLSISDNIISGCSNGILVSTSNYSPSWHWVDPVTLIEENLIINNTNGITLYAWQMFTPCVPIIRNNTITNNENGIYLTYLFSYNNPTLVYNNIYANLNYNINNQVPENNVNASYNWWGTTDKDTIEEKIFDYYDDFNLGKVYYEPFELELNPNAPNLPLMVDFIHSSEPLYVSRKMELDASACYGEYSNISNYSWDFGDNNTTILSIPTVTHTYTTAGEFDVTLTVTDEYGFQNSTQKTITVLADNVATTSSHNYNGEWYTADFTIALSAIDSESGVAETYYQINDGATKTLSADGQPFIITEGADNKLEYWSEDKAGNLEDVKVLSGIKLDKTNPIIGTPVTIPEDDIQENQDVKVTVDVSDSLSGVESVTLSYSIDEGISWQDLAMNLNSTNGLWQATIPGQAIWTNVSYKILCFDNAGNSASSNGANIYGYQVIPEFPSWIILPLFLIVTLSSVIIRKKMRGH